MANNRPNRTGTWMLIHQVTATYMITDGNFTAHNYLIRNSNQHPLNTQENLQGHLWDLSWDKDSKSYLISPHQKCNGETLYLEAQDTTSSSQEAFVNQESLETVDIQRKKRQRWILEPVSLDRKTYAIRSLFFEDYALGIQNNYCQPNLFIVALPTYGKPTIHHYWRVYNPFKDK